MGRNAILLNDIALLNLNPLPYVLPTRAYNNRPSLVVVLSILVSMPLLFLSTLASADEKDTINMIVGLTRTLDDNLFRQSSSVRPASDTVTSAYAGIRVDKQYSMQRLKFDYTLNSYNYQNNKKLNFNAGNYKATWLWSLTPRLIGSISSEKTQTQYGFLDVGVRSTPAISTNEVQNFVADWSPYGNWHMLGGFTRTLSTNSVFFQPDRGSTYNSLDFGLKYAFTSGSGITLMEHQRQGDFAIGTVSLGYPSKFSENESEAKIDWLLSGKSILNMRAAYVQRNHENVSNFPSRDYDGLVGSVNYTWTPTSKLGLTLAIASDINSYQTNYSNYNRMNTLSFSPLYAYSEKLTVRGNASVMERSFLGGGVIPDSNRVDTTQSTSLAIDWMPRRYVTIGANLQQSSRSSNVAGFDFSDLSTGVTANLNF